MKLKEFLDKENISIQMLMQHTKLSRNCIWKIITNQTTPNFHTTEKLVKFSKGKITFKDYGWTKEGIRLWKI
jgi:predicted DNA-binding transcriptional regulator AlpA